MPPRPRLRFRFATPCPSALSLHGESHPWHYDPGVASYAVVSNNPVALGNDDVQALVVSDGNTHAVWGDSDLAASLRDDMQDWPDSQDGEATLGVALLNLSYFSVDGPHTFEGSTDDAGPALARTYGIA